MPTYEYLCTACGHDLEAVQSFSDDPLVTCPECGGVLRKVFGSVGIVLKGSGFYKTDNRRSGKSGDSGSPSGSPSESSAKSTSSNGSSSNGSGSGGSTSEKSGSSAKSEAAGKSESSGNSASSVSSGSSKGDSS
ncbi:MAG TPA: FmdB family zinc ribbon protein [Acidimicrobiales bacterium]|nr:FmdB family zinc ribbon protein [Acidimicrobiales bacterium]